jgi:hypothetical protein
MLRKQLVTDVIFNIMEQGVVVVPKRGLIWRLGWSNDRPGVWKELLDVWVECGGERKALHVTEFWDRLVLFASKPGISPVTEWAKDAELRDQAA